MSITVRDIYKSFGSFRAIDGISLNLPRGGLIALLGPSGCGKTTLLRIIAGLESADHGSIMLAGRETSTQHVRERRVGFVFQHYALFRHLTVFENVAFGLRVKPRAKRLSEEDIRAKAGCLLELVQLSWLANSFPAQLSGGQRQRVALARALAVEPEVLLLDEPFGALDAKVRKELRRWLRQLHDELQITSVFVTHDQEEALEVADKVVLMNKGRIEQIGTPRQIYQTPATAFAYGFIGSVNEFKGKIEGANLRVGDDLLPHATPNLSDGADVVAYARPHEINIIMDASSHEGIAAKVNRILDAGSTARIELVAAGKASTPSPTYFEVDLAPDCAAEMGITTGQNVRLVTSRLRVFDTIPTGSPL